MWQDGVAHLLQTTIIIGFTSGVVSGFLHDADVDHIYDIVYNYIYIHIYIYIYINSFDCFMCLVLVFSVCFVI